MPISPRRRRWLQQSTYSRVAISTWSIDVQRAALSDQFGLVEPDRGFRERVVVGVAAAADAALEACLFDPFGVANGEVLHAAVGVVHEPVQVVALAAPEGHLERVQRQIGA